MKEYHPNRERELIPILLFMLSEPQELYCIAGIVYSLSIGRQHVEKCWLILKAEGVISFKEEKPASRNPKFKMKLFAVNKEKAEYLLSRLNQNPDKIVDAPIVNTITSATGNPTLAEVLNHKINALTESNSHLSSRLDIIEEYLHNEKPLFEAYLNGLSCDKLKDT